MTVTAERRGAIAALVVAVLIGVLFVALRPENDPHRTAAPSTSSSTTAAPTTTVAPAVRLCDLARQFADAESPTDPNLDARLAETFYTQARLLVSGDLRAEYEAASRYYTEYNAIGEPDGYDAERITKSGNGERWTQLISRPPPGVDDARASVSFGCGVDLPPPPTVTTTTLR